jgi:hypothetical protein
MAEQGWYILAEHHWYIIAEHRWYIIVRTLTHAIPNDDRCRDVTITLHQFERWGLSFQSAAIFEDQQAISRPVLARFSDVAGKQFSSLASNRERIKKFFIEALDATDTS